jgi:CheY-like chemotaxis protein
VQEGDTDESDTITSAPDTVASAIEQVKTDLDREFQFRPLQYDVDKTILWVDDRPSNNAHEIAKLREDNGYRVIEATSTAAALTALRNNQNPDVIITDMGREEDGKFKPDAGLNLIRSVRAMGIKAPIYIYTSPRRAEQIHDEVKAAGGNGATGSPVELFSLIRQIS